MDFLYRHIFVMFLNLSQVLKVNYRAISTLSNKAIFSLYFKKSDLLKITTLAGSM